MPRWWSRIVARRRRRSSSPRRTASSCGIASGSSRRCSQGRTRRRRTLRGRRRRQPPPPRPPCQPQTSASAPPAARRCRSRSAGTDSSGPRGLAGSFTASIPSGPDARTAANRTPARLVEQGFGGVGTSTSRGHCWPPRGTRVRGYYRRRCGSTSKPASRSSRARSSLHPPARSYSMYLRSEGNSVPGSKSTAVRERPIAPTKYASSNTTFCRPRGRSVSSLTRTGPSSSPVGARSRTPRETLQLRSSLSLCDLRSAARGARWGRLR